MGPLMQNNYRGYGFKLNCSGFGIGRNKLFGPAKTLGSN